MHVLRQRELAIRHAARAVVRMMCALILAGAGITEAGAALGAGGRDPALRLELDDDLSSGVALGGTTSPLVAIGVTDLQHRIAKVRGEIVALEVTRSERAARLAAREKLLTGLRTVVQAQQQAVAVLRAPPPAAPSTRVQASPVSAAPLAARPVPAPIPSAAPAGIAVDRLLLDGVLGAVIVGLLGWGLYLRSRNAVQARELSATAAVPRSSAADRPPSGEVKPRTGGVRAQAKVASGAPTSAPGDRPRTSPDTGVRVDGPAGDMQQPIGNTLDPGVPAHTAPEPIELADIGPASPAASPEPREPVDWSKTMLTRKAADPNALKEVDTLLAYEDFNKAELLLDALMRNNPGNPEYYLRLLHIQAATGEEKKAAEAERILASMMYDPLSETIGRVKDIGRGLMPGHPLFDEAVQAADANKALAGEVADTHAGETADDRVADAAQVNARFDSNGAFEPVETLRMKTPPAH